LFGPTGDPRYTGSMTANAFPERRAVPPDAGVPLMPAARGETGDRPPVILRCRAYGGSGHLDTARRPFAVAATGLATTRRTIAATVTTTPW
jgi:hypothetical protein